MRFFIGLHIIAHLYRFERCMVSMNSLWDRVSDIDVNTWILDSGAFTEIAKHGGFRHTVDEHAAQVERWATCGEMLCAVSRDWPCEPPVRKVTGLTVAEHQRRTVQGYRDLRRRVHDEIHIMPVLQGYKPADYLRCIEMYGDLIEPGMWVGVGSVCKRNASPAEVEAVVGPIRHARPDLCLHGFGVKKTALAWPFVRDSFATTDSMAWSRAARYDPHGDANGWRDAKQYLTDLDAMPVMNDHVPPTRKAESLWHAAQNEQLNFFA